MSRTSLIPASTLIAALVVLLAANIAPAQQGPDTVTGFIVGSPGEQVREGVGSRPPQRSPPEPTHLRPKASQ